MPTVFPLANLSRGLTVAMFPAFHQPSEALGICREVATSMTSWHEFCGKDGYHLSVNLLGTSEKSISLISELMEAMATCLQNYCPRGGTQFDVIIHKESIQVSSQLSCCVITFIIA